MEREWIEKALDMGFSTAVPLNVAALQPRADVRAMCAEDKCRAYGKNWTCPPHCGSLEDCEQRLRQYKSGILLQTVGQLKKTIDTRGYREAEQRHLAMFHILTEQLREVHPEGKPCITEFEVLERQEGYTKLQLRPITGRTHQLRVHCAHLGHPILGDPQYGSEESRAFSETLGLPYQMLCAKKLELQHPITGEKMILESNMDVQI